MEKKLIAQGPKNRKSYTITLPIEWVKNENLEEKKIVNLEIIGNKIIISKFKDSEKRIIINENSFTNGFVKVLPGLYRNGINEIKINYETNKALDQIINIIEKKLIGYEIIEQTNSDITIKEITKNSEEDFKIIFRRIFRLIIELSNEEDNKKIVFLQRNINKLTNYCQRILLKKGHSEYDKVPLYYLILDRLDKITDEYIWIKESKIKTSNQNKNLKKINTFFKAAYEIFYKFSTKEFDKYQYESHILKNEIKKKERITNTNIHLHNLSRIINSLFGDIFMLKFKE